MRVRLFVILLMLLMVLFGQSPTPVLAVLTATTSPTLSEFLSGAECSRACWLDIEPGATSENDVTDILENNEIFYQTSRSTDPTNLGFSLSITENMGFPYIDVTSTPVGVDVESGIVYRVTIPVHDVSLQMMIDNFGFPDRILETSREDGGLNLNIVYEDEGIVFYAATTFTSDQIIYIFLLDEIMIDRFYVEDEPFTRHLQDCNIFADLCLVSTATPSPTSIPATVNLTNVPATVTLVEGANPVQWVTFNVSLSQAPVPDASGHTSMTILAEELSPSGIMSWIQTAPIGGTFVTDRPIVLHQGNWQAGWQVRIRARNNAIDTTGDVGRVVLRIVDGAEFPLNYTINTVDSVTGQRLTGSEFNGGNDTNAPAGSRNVVVFTVLDNDD